MSRQHPAGAHGAHAAGTTGGPIAHSSSHRPRIALAYAVTTLICVVAVALVSTYASRLVATDAATGEAITRTDRTVTRHAQPVLTDAMVRGEPAAVAAFDQAVREEMLGASLIRVKVWDESGTIIYSDETRLVGERFGLRGDELGALHGSEARAEISDLTEPENRFEERGVELLEVYYPMRTPADVPVLFEAYYRYDGVAESAQRVWMRFAPLSLAALVLLEILQVPIALLLARRLRRAQEEREGLLRHALSAVDDERRRIAGDLHDGVVQDLAGVAFTLGAAAHDGRAGRVDPDRLADAAAVIRRSAESLRSLLVDIYPPDLDRGGLPDALTELLPRLVPPGTRTVLDIDRGLTTLPAAHAELVYRVAQEGVRNVVRHADADAVGLSLHREADTVVLVVADDGRGCDPGVVAARPGHLGLRALAGLAAERGAALVIDSGPGRGTTLRLEVPV